MSDAPDESSSLRGQQSSTLSVHRVVQAGNRVVFSASGSFVQDEQTGETMELVEKGGMYMLRLWVKAQGFGWPETSR